MKRVSAKQAQGILESLIEEAAAAHVTIGITGERAEGVLVPLSDWQAIQETLYILSVPGLRESIREGMAEPLDACSETLDW
ncbi:MAG TPA: type II toxin-antitoxin system Phd/YefM family antitoxin [Thermoanaerobaculia bacterium]|nr:type II toxin-antitoxin system Phd/YefM family antitoxin [Thermoanaerobaculia bacterium]